jgi:uncharacterized YigZ family protein
LSKFKSIARISPNNSSVYKEKGSKFLGFALYCNTEKEAQVFLQELRDKHPNAVHVCYAYQLGIENPYYRFNDDGEPSNSAGAPIYGQIQSYGITNVVIAVVRYYGGTKLGVGGLINAYRTAAKDIIELAGTIEMELSYAYRIVFTYAEMALLMDHIKKLNLTIIKQHFENECYVEIEIKASELEKLKRLKDKFETLLIIEIPM